MRSYQPGAEVNTAIRCSLKGWSDHVTSTRAFELYLSLSFSLYAAYRTMWKLRGGQITVTIRAQRVRDVNGRDLWGALCSFAGSARNGRHASKANAHKSYLTMRLRAHRNHRSEVNSAEHKYSVVFIRCMNIKRCDLSKTYILS